MNQIDGDDDIDWEDEYDPDWDWDEDDKWECVLGAECLFPHYFHRSSECYNVEMAMEWREEEEKETQAKSR